MRKNTQNKTKLQMELIRGLNYAINDVTNNDKRAILAIEISLGLAKELFKVSE